MSSCSTTLRVHDPRMPAPASTIELARRKPSLAGETILLLDNTKLDRDYGPYGAIFDAVRAGLTVLVPDIGFDELTDDLNEGTATRLDALADEVADRKLGGVVIALCDWGISQPSTILAAALERRGVPVVLFATGPGFLQAYATASRLVPGLPLIRLSLLRSAGRKDIEAEVDRLLEKVVSGLTAEPAELLRRFDDHNVPRAAAATPSGQIELDADDDPIMVFTELMARDGLGDGFLLVPPTQERVEAFLAAAGRAPDEPIWPSITPRPVPVTAQDVAVIAVIAGCEPTWAPVVFAAYEAMAAPEFRLFQAAITTHPGGTLVLASGRETSGFGLEHGRGSLGPGFAANARIGRAVALSYSFLLGAQPGGSDLTSQGSPAEYSYCCAENLTESPWPGLHVDLGFPKKTTVTVVKCEGPHNMIDQKSVDPEHLLETFVSTIATLGANTSYAPGCQTILMLNPEHAALLAGAGWDKKRIAGFLFERARIPRAQLMGRGQAPMWPASFYELNEVPIVTQAEDLLVAVVGGAGPASQVAIPWGMGRGATRAI